MATVEIEKIAKSFGTQRAVDGVSFEVEKGEIFGLLGPNGAGKTTTIRILLDIFKPDSGRVAILGGPMTEAKKDHIGYLPEERGLYQDITLDRCLTYLASLKGLTPAELHKRINAYLERFDLASSRNKKLKELSKGMQQKAQLIVTLVHEPDLVIIDEPFSSLDPVNTQMVKDLLREQRSRGVHDCHVHPPNAPGGGAVRPVGPDQQGQSRPVWPARGYSTPVFGPGYPRQG